MAKKIRRKQFKTLLKAQQGELDAVYMYEKLAKRVRDDADRSAFMRLAGDEARHAEVFRKYTEKDIKPKKTKGIFVPLLYTCLGKKKVYPLIAQKEYDAADKYKKIVDDFPEVREVMDDEVHHGDAVKKLISD